jgi:hypothetical protein
MYYYRAMARTQMTWIRATRTEQRKWRRAAKEQRLSVSEFIRRLIEDHIKSTEQPKESANG